MTYLIQLIIIINRGIVFVKMKERLEYMKNSGIPQSLRIDVVEDIKQKFYIIIFLTITECALLSQIL